MYLAAPVVTVNLFELVNETAPLAVMFVASGGEAIAPVKSTQVVLLLDPCNFKLAAVAPKICVADVFWIYKASN